MNAMDYAKLQIHEAFALLDACVGDLDDDHYNWNPSGTCNPIAKSHVHAVTSIDFFVNGVLKGAPLRWPEVAAAHGLPANPLQLWQSDARIPLCAIREYATSAEAIALDYLTSLSEADMDREVETQFFGKRSVAYIVQLAGMHLAGHTGDMAAVKGIQGLKGLPF
jgi:hypothetical protein